MKTALLTATLGLSMGLSNLHAAVIEYRYGTSNALVTNYTGVDQAFLLVSTGSQGNYNTGGYDGMIVGRSNARQGIIAFDLSSMQGKFNSINSAQLTFYRDGTATTSDFTISMYQIFDANAGWKQGTGTGTAAGPDNSVTYLNQNYSSVPAQNISWKNSSGTSVGNFSSAYSTLSLLDSVTYTTTSTSITFDIPVMLVTNWITAPGSNAGLAFIPSGSPTANSVAANLGSSSADEALRPLLTLNYTAIPEPRIIAYLLLGGMVALLIKRMRRSAS